MIDIEICINSDVGEKLHKNITTARRGGAARIELCSAMHLHGLTPTIEQIDVARSAFHDVPGLMVMIRPHAGDFVFTESDVELMLRQIKDAAAHGADGVVVGVLRGDSTIDIDALNRLVHAAKSKALSVTFHRAFDAAPDMEAALDILTAAGVDRILSSGVLWGASGGALEGLSRLSMLLKRAGEIEIIIGGGVSPGNAKHIIDSVENRSGKFSLHAYSGVLHGDLVSEQAVRTLANMKHQFTE